MSPLLTGGLAVFLFLLLVSQGMPIAFSFAIVGTLGLILIRGLDTALMALGSMPFTWSSAQMLISVPLFILMGYFAYVSAISQDLYEASHKWFGRFPGGVAMATTAACTAFGACCGAVPAAAATMATISYPEMKKLNYDQRLSTGCIAAGATISILIPPSIPLILYGLLTETSISQLFIAGIIPGIMLAVLFLIAIFVMCKRNPKLGPAGPSFSWKQRFISLKGVWGMITLFVLVIGGLYLGAFTPTEAGAIGALGAFIIALVMRRLTFSNLIFAAKATARLTSFVAMLVIGAQVFNLFLGVAGISSMFAKWVEALPLSPYFIMAGIIVLYFILGMFLEIMSIFLLTIPTLGPVISGLGFDLVWFGIIVVLLAQIGFLTPPIGMCSFIVQGVTKVPLEDVFRGAVPFVLMMLVAIVILLVFPQVALFLPGVMK